VLGRLFHLFSPNRRHASSRCPLRAASLLDVLALKLGPVPESIATDPSPSPCGRMGRSCTVTRPVRSSWSSPRSTRYGIRSTTAGRTVPSTGMEELLRDGRAPVGVVTDGRWWAIVSARENTMAASGIVDAQTWTEEPPTRNAFIELDRKSVV
jgi:hypothetical protein